MGTHFHDQPPEHWAGPESLDPTPIWKQGIVVGVLLLVSLALIAAISVPALLPQVVTPPAAVPGGRVVLARSDAPAPGQPPKRFGPPLVDDAQAFWLVQPHAGEIIAVRAKWSTEQGGSDCDVVVFPAASDASLPVDRRPFFQACPRAQGWLLGPRGEPFGAPRALDRYLVSVDRDRIIVNISRVITGVARTDPPSASPRATP